MESMASKLKTIAPSLEQVAPRVVPLNPTVENRVLSEVDRINSLPSRQMQRMIDDTRRKLAELRDHRAFLEAGMNVQIETMNKAYEAERAAAAASLDDLKKQMEDLKKAMADGKAAHLEGVQKFRGKTAEEISACDLMIGANEGVLAGLAKSV